MGIFVESKDINKKINKNFVSERARKAAQKEEEKNERIRKTIKKENISIELENMKNLIKKEIESVYNADFKMYDMAYLNCENMNFKYKYINDLFDDYIFLEMTENEKLFLYNDLVEYYEKINKSLHYKYKNFTKTMEKYEDMGINPLLINENGDVISRNENKKQKIEELQKQKTSFLQILQFALLFFIIAILLTFVGIFFDGENDFKTFSNIYITFFFIHSFLTLSASIKNIEIDYESNNETSNAKEGLYFSIYWILNVFIWVLLLIN